MENETLVLRKNNNQSKDRKYSSFLLVIFIGVFILINVSFSAYMYWSTKEELNSLNKHNQEIMAEIKKQKSDISKEKVVESSAKDNHKETQLTIQKEEIKETPSKTYTVVAGDTLSTISEKNKVSIESLRDLNKLEDDMIYEGQVLKYN
ncbi:LysM peptidoglycan-binding domain-containing protein [Vagococcus carniphilus]|uniref:LysM peptidoglycan-binding domain-containing protein n=1 Tax=Vagococcus carniphilus TaxID=218144 RepID=UPI00289165CA|nr:LysM peptidoglycan-binding domain-containing protein [Vagococcus carniphilus]MDT2831725.1 LysM peptidoglycan-binding domain-containing protein [Vagococcus carniphilus]MDT2840578.1 LysM peptidoglycan-binding domain-containing protein [Vagococcus carniphilus]MDT2855236.1 LysM peptidoglycan-binding domain-containing protein [Vagococcus carniphilus]